jgi:hypothetical protein
MSADCLHIFFVNNPLQKMLVCMIIDRYKISLENILIVYSRSEDPLLHNCKSYIHRYNFLDRITNKLFGDNLSTFFLSFYISIICNKFYLYAAWDNNDVIRISELKKCKGIYYIEEGLLSYSSKNSLRKNKFNMRKRIDRASKESREFLFNVKNLGSFSLGRNAFPELNNNLQLKNFLAVKNFYIPITLGIRKIGILPAIHRLRKNELKEFIEKLIFKIGRFGAIKLHPSFYTCKSSENFVILCINRINKNILILDKNVVLEAEMLFEKKIFYGPKSSVHIYADLFKSTYKVVL